jgi:hypothetical protein
MSDRTNARIAAAAMFLTVLSVAPSSGQQSHPRADPASGFDPHAAPARTNAAAGTTPDAARVNPASPVLLLPSRGNAQGGVDHGLRNLGVVFGARVYSEKLAQAIELFYYIPSNSDNFYREGDYRSVTGRIGGDRGTDNGAYFCPDGYAAIGLQGASGAGVDRLGLVCGQIGNFSKVVALPIFGGGGGNAYYDVCSSTPSLGFLTGVRVRSGLWMDSIQGLCQTAASADPAMLSAKVEPAKPEPAKAEPMTKLTEDRAASVGVGADRGEVLQKLGEPYSKISGDFERFTYQLQSGGTLRIEFESGRVIRIQSTGGN